MEQKNSVGAAMNSQAREEAAERAFMDWALVILGNEGLFGWQIKPGEAYCWAEQKVIAFQGEDKVLFLHEVAHALVPEAEGPLRNHYHGGMWSAKFAELIKKYFVPKDWHTWREEHPNAEQK